MQDFTRTDPFEEEQIETPRQRLTRLDRAALIRFYLSSLHPDLLAREKAPRAPYLRQLLKAWKERVEREQAAAGEGVLLPTTSLLMTGNPAGNRDIPNPVVTPGRHASPGRFLSPNTGGFYVQCTRESI